MNIDWKYEIKQIDNIANKTLKKEIKQMQNEGFKYRVVDTFNHTYECIYDVCGFASIYFKDRRNKIYRSYKKYYEEINKQKCTSNHFAFMPSIYRQEFRLNKAVATAVANYLNEKFENVFYVNSWID